ncbi:hypothetical protein C8Q70DRAFT_980983 [Cubamyces menziesii]|nr:hypothetical protein C8Q70DRAFT_980983 [Cubamyces menziesii]
MSYMGSFTSRDPFSSLALSYFRTEKMRFGARSATGSYSHTRCRRLQTSMRCTWRSAMSMATTVYSALQTLADKLKMSSEVRPALVANAMTTILNSRPYPDTALTIETLSRQGCPVLAIPYHSEMTAQRLFSFLLRDKVRLAN